jgi:hypothetical protein
MPQLHAVPLGRRHASPAGSRRVREGSGTIMKAAVLTHDLTRGFYIITAWQPGGI